MAKEGIGATGKDLLGRAAGRMGDLAGMAAATAAQWYRLDGEQRRLAELRAQALQTRARIGEEMYRLWQARALPPSSLDDLFREVDRIMAAIEEQRARVEDLRARFSGEGAAPPDDPLVVLDRDSQLQVLDRPLPPPPVPAAPTRRIDLRDSTDRSSDAQPTDVPCPRCGRPGPAGKTFCGYCGARLT